MPEQPDTYAHFVRVNDIDGARSKGFLLRFPFYVQGTQKAHILVSPHANPTELENTYEIVLGDQGNTEIVIRKRINGAPLGRAIWPNVLSPYKKKKFVFEVQTDGFISVYSEDNPYKPLLTVFDAQPIALEYVSFKNWAPEKTYFYYGNLPLTNLEQIKQELLTQEYKTLAVNPLLANWEQVLTKITLQTLIKNSQYFESWQNVYTKYVTVSEQWKPTGYSLRFPVYLQGASSAKILLTSVENPNFETDSVYEIHIGWGGNSWSRILRNGVELTRVYEQNILNQWQPTKFVVEVTSDGVIKVFTSHNPWVPLLQAFTQPLDVKYVSFASPSRIQYFWEVNEQTLITTPVKEPVREPLVNVKHPLFEVVDYPVGLVDLCMYILFFNVLM